MFISSALCRLRRRAGYSKSSDAWPQVHYKSLQTTICRPSQLTTPTPQLKFQQQLSLSLASIAACSRGNWLFYPRATRRASDAQGLTGTCTPLGHATRMSRVRPRDAAAEEQYDYSGQKRSASFDMGALLVTSPLLPIHLNWWWCTVSTQLCCWRQRWRSSIIARSPRFAQYLSYSPGS